MSKKDTKSSAENPAEDIKTTELSEKSLQVKNQELIDRETKLILRENQVEEREATVEHKEKALDERAAALDEKEEALNNIGKPAEKIPGLEFTFEKKKYKFSDDTPKKIRLNGEPYTQKEIVKNEELLILLLGFGEKYGLISKIK